MPETEPTQNVRSLFLAGERLRNDLTTFPDSTNSTYQETLSTAISTYEACLSLADRVSLFSPNESLEDIASFDIQFMSINFHRAELVQKIRSNGLVDRKNSLLEARGSYEGFIKLLDAYDVLRPSDAKLWELYLQDKGNFSTTSTRDAVARRDAKVARYREEQDLKRKLEYLRQNPKLTEQDDQVVRELYLTDLAFMVHQAFAGLESIAQELHIISLAPPAPTENVTPDSDGRDDRRTGNGAYLDRLDGQLPGLRYSGPILSADGRPLRPFTLTDNRQQLRKGVFRPDHNLPTMSIDEYLEEEKRRGGIIEGGGEASGIRPEPDEDNLVKADEETMKARAWDEFKEDNPKGSGNTLNRG